MIADPVAGFADQKGTFLVQIVQKFQFVGFRQLLYRFSGGGGCFADQMLQKVLDAVRKNLVVVQSGFLMAVQTVVAFQVFLHADGVRDIRVDADGSDNIAVFVPDVHGGRAQGIGGLCVGDVVVVIAVLGCAPHDFQAQIGHAVSDLAPGDMAVSDVDDGTVIGRGQIVQHNLAVWPQVMFQQTQYLLVNCFMILHVSHGNPPGSGIVRVGSGLGKCGLHTKLKFFINYISYLKICKTKIQCDLKIYRIFMEYSSF